MFFFLKSSWWWFSLLSQHALPLPSPRDMTKAQDPSAFTRSTWSLPVNGNFSDLLRGELLQIKEVGKRKVADGRGDICWWFGWLVPILLVVSVAGSEHDLFFLYILIFSGGNKNYKHVPENLQDFPLFSKLWELISSIVFWMDSFSAWAMGCNCWKRPARIPVSRGIHKSSKRKVGFNQNQVMLKWYCW